MDVGDMVYIKGDGRESLGSERYRYWLALV